MPLLSFHPAVAAWFRAAFGAPTAVQRQAWPAILSQQHTLIAAPTGSGKTLAAFLRAIDALVREGEEAGQLPDEGRVLYVSPLKALGHDIEKNLQQPLAGVAEAQARQGRPMPAIRTWVRSGDTKGGERSRAVRRPPHIIVTTPESLYLLLTSEGGRRILATVRCAIVDEIHALVRDKRGAHLALSLERLEALVGARGGRLQRIGLSATQKPIDAIARFLVGNRQAPCHVVDVGQRRQLDLALVLPGSPLDGVMSHEVWSEVYGQLATLIDQHTTTLIFVNTRKAAERVARQLSERLGETQVGCHHGSLARQKRLDAEQRLKAGALRALVATASLELGIDIGEVDLVCQLGSPRAIATFLQRVGRSGHQLGGLPKGRLFPLSRDDLVECCALLQAVRAGELDRVRIPEAPLDVLAQQLVAAAAVEDCALDALFACVRGASPYSELSRADFDAVVQMLAAGFSTRRGRRAALVHHDAVHGRIRARRGARLLALTSGGAIPDSFDYQVVLEPENLPVGSVHEDFAIESNAGDIFQLGNTSYRIRKMEPGALRVEDARGLPPTLPFWIAEAPGRSDELSAKVSDLRAQIAQLLEAEGPEGASAWLCDSLELDASAARQLVEYLAAAQAQLGVMPTQQRLVLERFFDETGSMHLVLHAPYGTRLNRGLGLALRKRFCRSFNVELQAAANDDAVVLSLGPMHSFVLADVFGFLKPGSVREVLIQAVLPAPMFSVRFRWNASRALAVPRSRGSKKVPPRIQRMLADDLLAVAFPDQVACAENLQGEREVPDHPLVRQTIADCLHEAMDVDGLEALLRRVARGEVACVARDVTEPSQLASEILNARPYAFLDDAPLEERRTQAVVQRRWLDPATARDLGALDAAAIARVVADCEPPCRDADELHDALLVHGCLPEAEGRARGAEPLFARLVEAGRAAWLRWRAGSLWIAAERLPLWRMAVPEAHVSPAPRLPAGLGCEVGSRDEAVRELVRGRLELTGPVTAAELAQALGFSAAEIDAALAALESEGFVLRGQFRPGAGQPEWCERRLLARIHRATLERLRSEIEPVAPADFMRFLFVHQHVAPEARMQGSEGLFRVVEQLAGFELSAAAWERDVLPARVADYAPMLLDHLTFGGRVVWARAVPDDGGRREGPVRATPIGLYPRGLLSALRAGATVEPALSLSAQKVRAQLAARGASFVDELLLGAGCDRGQVEEALAELAAQGLVTSDGFMGLRALLGESGIDGGGSARRGAPVHAGRYALLPAADEADAEAWARSLLDRWGVVFKRLFERERSGLPWLSVLRVLRRMEARGEVRGGRFVSGFSGEQYARPEAVTALRRIRRAQPSGQLVVLSACDPLNLSGILVPGARVPALSASRLLFRDGIPRLVWAQGQCQWLGEPTAEAARLEAQVRSARAGPLADAAPHALAGRVA